MLGDHVIVYFVYNVPCVFSHWPHSPGLEAQNIMETQDAGTAMESPTQGQVALRKQLHWLSFLAYMP